MLPLSLFLSWKSWEKQAAAKQSKCPAPNQCWGSPTGRRPSLRCTVHSFREMAAQDELTLLAGELARKIEGTKVNEVFARGVPGITHETFTSEAAVRALMTCERLFEVDE